MVRRTSKEVEISLSHLQESDNDDDSDYSQNNEDEENERTDEYQQLRDFAGKETRRVQLGRTFVILSLIVAGAVVSSLTYIVLDRELRSDGSDAVSNRIRIKRVESIRI